MLSPPNIDLTMSMPAVDHPFRLQYLQDESDQTLVQKALDGQKEALEALVRRHQPYIYNVAWKLVYDPDDALDLTQEALVKVVTKLSQYRQEGEFRAWLYRIVFNHFLKMKKQHCEIKAPNFDAFQTVLDQTPDQELSAQEEMELKESIEDWRLRCMSGMLLCLDRKQRLVYVLGELFGLDHQLGAELLETSPGNFRVMLHRARKDLYQFMDRQCGLVNPKNPCRCKKKTKAGIASGRINPKDLRFNLETRKRISDFLAEKSGELVKVVHEKQSRLQRDSPFREEFTKEQLVEQVLDDQRLREWYDV